MAIIIINICIAMMLIHIIISIFIIVFVCLFVYLFFLIIIVIILYIYMYIYIYIFLSLSPYIYIYIYIYILKYMYIYIYIYGERISVQCRAGIAMSDRRSRSPPPTRHWTEALSDHPLPLPAQWIKARGRAARAAAQHMVPAAAVHDPVVAAPSLQPPPPRGAHCSLAAGQLGIAANSAPRPKRERSRSPAATPPPAWLASQPVPREPRPPATPPPAWLASQPVPRELVWQPGWPRPPATPPPWAQRHVQQ